ncbi:MAG TPA: sialidase family protein, partial [Candidatus Kapabacteria bacterium]|nr:sialidase family protein [Candidatus Kapabacteria bacterium]
MIRNGFIAAESNPPLASGAKKLNIGVRVNVIMHLRIPSVLLVLLCIPLITAAQSSAVFLNPGYSRPPSQPKPLSIPQTTQTTVSNPSPWNFPNINITSFLARDENEPSIAINPSDPNNFIIGANDYRSDSSLFCFVTIDGGLHWRSYPMQKNNTYAASAFNPAVAFNSNGKAFYTFGRAQLSHLGNPYAINDVACFTNANKGDSASWTLPVRIHFDSLNSLSAKTFADKFYTAVDRGQNSPYIGRVYTAWVEYVIGEKNHILISRSLDEGKTWSTPLSITDTANYQCPIPAIGPNGELYVSFLDLDTNHLNIHCTKSLDGGTTFSPSANKIISPYKNLGSIDSSGAYAHPVLKGHVRASSFPSIAVDRSPLHSGRIYVTWAGKGNDNRHHIYLSSSDDKAQTWSTPKTIENDPNPAATDKFLPWIAVDNTNGDIGVLYYDSRNDQTNNILTDAYLSFSHDGASTFTPLRISSASFDPRANSSLDSTFIGDYLGLDAENKHWYPVWSDTRVGYDQDLYIGIVRPYAPSAPKEFVVIEDPATHFAMLRWKHDAIPTIGEPLGKYSFKFWRVDQVIDQTLLSSER